MNWKIEGIKLGVVAALAAFLFGIKAIVGFEITSLSGIGVILANQIFNKD